MTGYLERCSQRWQWPPPFCSFCRYSSSGQALIEFALVLPIFLLLIVGGLHLGLLIVDRQRVVHTAIETAYEAAKNPTGCGNSQTVADRVFGSPVTVSCQRQGQEYEVTVTHTFPQLLPWLPGSVQATERALIR